MIWSSIVGSDRIWEVKVVHFIAMSTLEFPSNCRWAESNSDCWISKRILSSLSLPASADTVFIAKEIFTLSCISSTISKFQLYGNFKVWLLYYPINRLRFNTKNCSSVKKHLKTYDWIHWDLNPEHLILKSNSVLTELNYFILNFAYFFPKRKLIY